MHFQIGTSPLIRTALLSAFSITTLFLLTACGGGGGDNDDDNGNNIGQVGTSSNNATRSHNAGRVCSECHNNSGGGGQGVFTIAGTVYTNGSGTAVAPNGTVKVYSPTRSTLVATLEVDAKGNFYTVNPITGITPNGLGGIDGIYVTVGNNEMPGNVSTSACNSCHGPTTVANPFGTEPRIY